MDSTFTMLRQLSRTRTNWVMKARLVYMWEVHPFSAGSPNLGEIIDYDLLLLDEEGVSIVAMLKSRWAYLFNPHLVEGGLYIIKNCIVKEANPTYRVADNNLTLTLMHSTSISAFPTEDFKVPFHYFDFLPFHQLHQRVGSLSKLTDIVGRLRSTTALEFVGSNGSVKRRLIRLEDSSLNHVDMALLGKHADLITAGDLVTAPILIVTSTLLKTWHGFLSISSTTATKLYRDLDIPETESLKSTYTSYH